MYDGENKTLHYAAKVQANIKVKNNVLETGIEVKNTEVSYNARTRTKNVDTSFYNGEGVSSIYSIFANYNLNKDKWNINLGARASYYTLSSEAFVEPRVFVGYRLSETINLKGSSGIYAQYLAHVNNIEFSYGTGTGNVWKLADGDQTNIAKSWQSMVGISFNKKIGS